MEKKRKVGKQVRPDFFAEDDKIIAEYFTSVGYVDLWDCTDDWVNVARRLAAHKAAKVSWIDVRDRWYLIDKSLEKTFNGELLTCEELGLQKDSTLKERFKIYTLRLHNCIGQMRKRSNKKKIVCICKEFYSDTLMNPPVFPTRFESPDEGAHCLDNSSLVLPPKIFKGQLFYLIDSEDTYSELANRYSLEYLVKIHGGRIVKKTDGQKDTRPSSSKNMPALPAAAVEVMKQNEKRYTSGRNAGPPEAESDLPIRERDLHTDVGKLPTLEAEVEMKQLNEQPDPSPSTVRSRDDKGISPKVAKQLEEPSYVDFLGEFVVYLDDDVEKQVLSLEANVSADDDQATMVAGIEDKTQLRCAWFFRHAIEAKTNTGTTKTATLRIG
ncbi:unnamed protein product [Orchesella dallaii]|uniref:Uncharacterized protein n=1 Tax=Orchesella dallaii TaxID=48710 RepID=A0ABP1SAE8_9HEXA